MGSRRSSTMHEHLRDIPLEFWSVLGEMAPYLLFGFLAAGFLSVVFSAEAVERHLGGHGIWPSVKAAAFGVPLPLCSCGVLPVAASLRKHGAGRGATTAFLLSTPTTGVDSILVTFSLLGPVFAIFRPVAALFEGILGGLLVEFFDSGNGVAEPKPATCTDECCSVEGKKGNFFYRVFRYGFITLPRDIGKSLLIGLVVAGIITAFIPNDFFAGVLGTGISGMIVMMLLGIPVYVCATASVPVAVALIAKGVSPGAALVFLMTGPATNAAALAIIWHIMGRRTTFIYLATVAVSAIASGLILDYIFNLGNFTPSPGMPWMMPGFARTTFALILLAVLAAGFYKPTLKGVKALPESNIKERITLVIKGMTCSHCAQSVQQALLGAPGVGAVEIDLNSGKAVVGGNKLDIDRMRKAIEGAGFQLMSWDGPSGGKASG